MRLRSVSELETTLRISAVAVCCSRASPSFTGQAREVRLFGGIPTSRGFGWIAGAWGLSDSRVDFLVCCLQWVAVFVLDDYARSIRRRSSVFSSRSLEDSRYQSTVRRMPSVRL